MELSYQCCHKSIIKGKENNNEGFDKLHIILLIHVYALAEILQVK